MLWERIKETYYSIDDIKLFNLTIGVAALNCLAFIWDQYGLQAPLSFEYLFYKSFLTFAPVFIGLSNFESKTLKHVLILTIFQFYSFYNTIYVHPTYYTAFMQFFIGIPLVYNWKKREFIPTTILGIYLYYISSICIDVSPSKVIEMNGAVIPCFILGIINYFVIGKVRSDKEKQMVFFQTIGHNLGFIIHELRNPLMYINRPKHKERAIEEINGILQVSNILWPVDSNRSSSNMPLEDVDTTYLINQELERYKSKFRSNDLVLEFESNKSVVRKVHQSTLRIIIKNILKNAFEEVLSNKLDLNKIKISQTSNQIEFSNSTSNPYSLERLLNPGFTTKKESNNIGLGTILIQELGKSTNIKVVFTKQNGMFSVKLLF